MSDAPIIVVSSPRRGLGKTTFIFNLAAALWQDNFQVKICSPTVSDFIEKRRQFCRKNALELPFPQVIVDVHSLPQEGENEVVLVEIPCEKNAEYADIFACAHTLITVGAEQSDVSWQLNDAYLNIIWQAKKKIAATGRKYLNWIVLENKISPDLPDWNEQIAEFSRRYGFRVSPQMRYREAYQHINEGYCAADIQKTLSDVYARHEILCLTDFMWQKPTADSSR